MRLSVFWDDRYTWLKDSSKGCFNNGWVNVFHTNRLIGQEQEKHSSVLITPHNIICNVFGHGFMLMRVCRKFWMNYARWGIEWY